MIKHHQQFVNTVIVRSIPINRKMKTYFERKFERMVKSNGREFASSKMKSLRDVLLSYRSDPYRAHRMERYFLQQPFRVNGWLKELFAYMDTHPHFTIDFVKMYCGFGEPIISPEEAADEYHQILLDISAKKQQMSVVPRFMTRWLEFLTSSKTRLYHLYWSIKGQEDHPYHRYVAHHSISEWFQYWFRWKDILLKPVEEKELSSFVSKLAPRPELYADYDVDTKSSKTFEDDVQQIMMLSPEAVDIFGNMQMIPAETYYWLMQGSSNLGIMESAAGFVYESEFGNYAFKANYTAYDGNYVGQIHHIPKGGTVDRRSIAVPNRFIQLGLAPFAYFLNSVLNRMPKDSTFNQSKFISNLQRRVDKEFYVGSVDLSKATDNLPLAWFEPILTVIAPKQCDTVYSAQLFDAVVHSKWKNGNNLSSWDVGQPLGTLPSFPILGLTHNIFLESLAIEEGYGHSPYVVLGDDVVITKERLRKSYIAQMTGRGIPLSLHKSYSGRLVEFAGRLIVKNQKPYYVSDHKVVTYNNLLDYQRATGVIIPYHHLSKSVQRALDNWSAKAGLNSKSLYNILLELEGIKPALSAKAESVAARYYYHRCSDKDIPSVDVQTGIFNFQGAPYLVSTESVEVRKNSLPAWYKDKFRPSTTDALLEATVLAVRDIG